MLALGTKSLLFGTHQCLFHPLTVALAWRRLYGRWPSWVAWVAIFTHDLGYLSSPEMDGPVGEQHPVRSARLAWKLVYKLARLFGRDIDGATKEAAYAHGLVLAHSRHLAVKRGDVPSDLCWADKACIFYDPQWLYILRARLSGEMKEWRGNAAKSGHVPLSATDAEWFQWYRGRVADLLDRELEGWR
jgi:hypothetical protein